MKYRGNEKTRAASARPAVRPSKSVTFRGERLAVLQTKNILRRDERNFRKVSLSPSLPNIWCILPSLPPRKKRLPDPMLLSGKNPQMG